MKPLDRVCPMCKSAPGDRCKDDNGYHCATHTERRGRRHLTLGGLAAKWCRRGATS